jgi:hypothetical protein
MLFTGQQQSYLEVITVETKCVWHDNKNKE